MDLNTRTGLYTNHGCREAKTQRVLRKFSSQHTCAPMTHDLIDSVAYDLCRPAVRGSFCPPAAQGRSGSSGKLKFELRDGQPPS